jgi:hypothetical protein
MIGNGVYGKEEEDKCGCIPEKGKTTTYGECKMGGQKYSGSTSVLDSLTDTWDGI